MRRLERREMVSWEYLWPTLRCRWEAGVSPLLSIGWWYLSSVSPRRQCCRVSPEDKGCRVYPLDPHPDAVALYSGCTQESAVTDYCDELKSVKRLRSSDLLIEVTSALQTKSFLLAKSFLNNPVTVSPHKTLNSCVGVISDPDLSGTPDSEILEGFFDQDVSQCVKRNSRNRRKCLKVQKREIKRKMAPHRPRQSAPTEYATDEEDMITYDPLNQIKHSCNTPDKPNFSFEFNVVTAEGTPLPNGTILAAGKQPSCWDLFLFYRRITIDVISSELRISHGSAHSIIYDDFENERHLVCLLPKMLPPKRKEMKVNMPTYLIDMNDEDNSKKP
ncbi:uncharacterized protein TNCV_2898251 [Trichonephila clavipes]|nr:uncharacterized protein TNCV_2898251 [Trichonephila clavipes]